MSTFIIKTHGRIWPWKPSVPKARVSPVVQALPACLADEFLLHWLTAHLQQGAGGQWSQHRGAAAESGTPVFKASLLVRY